MKKADHQNPRRGRSASKSASAKKTKNPQEGEGSPSPTKNPRPLEKVEEETDMAQVLAAPGAPGGNRGGGGGSGRRQPLPEPGDDATDEEVLEWGASLAEENIRQLTSNQLMRLVDAFNNGEFAEEDFVALARLVQYQGFNPAITAKALWLIKRARGISNDDFKSDITLGCVLFLTRGTNLVNMVKRMSDEGQQKVNDFVQKYSLKKGQVNADELTLSRIALTFYQVTVQAARAVSDMLPITPAEMHRISAGYPAAMMTQAFTSAIPVGKTYENDLAQAHCLYLIEFAKVINPAQREKGDALVLDGFITAFKAAYGARRPERNPQHIALLQDMGILTTPAAGGQEAPVDAVDAAAVIFRAKFGNMRF